MAVRAAVRFKPDVYRSSLETTVAGLDAVAVPPTGTIVMTAQLVAYDDAVVTGVNYKPGDPTTEQSLVVLYEEPLSQALGPFANMTQLQATAAWTTALQAFATRVTPAAATLVKAVRAARTAAPVVLG